MADEEHSIVAAIDFGTTYSGYAFSWLHEFKNNPTQISTFTWTSKVSGIAAPKTPTSVLFDDERKFHSFGFDAEEKYMKLSQENKHHEWLFFRRFKMQLYNRKVLSLDFKLKADNGMEMKAMDVFTAAIKYLKEHIITKCAESKTKIYPSEILFVLTVPAIWTDKAKQFMREAAENAGIERRHLLVALEPEAASLFCKYDPVERRPGREYDVFKPGAKYITVDAGGGTIDITAHEVEKGGGLKEIHMANGGDWGGTKVDEAFYRLLCDIFGEKVVETFSSENKYDMMELSEAFERKKKTINPELTGEIIFTVPASLSETFEKMNNYGKTALKSNNKYVGKVTWAKDKIKVDAGVCKDLFKESTDRVLGRFQDMNKNEKVHGTNFILMVGGFSESPMLKDAIKGTFVDKTVIIPKDPWLSVLKGAVIFGHQPRSVRFRVSKYTYGVETTRPFDESVHDKSNLFITDEGDERCCGIFSKYLEIGETIEVGCTQVEKRFRVIEQDQNIIMFPVYISTEKNPKYVTDPSCNKLGELRVHVPGEGYHRKVIVNMTFSGTELQVEATDCKTGEETSASFELLD